MPNLARAERQPIRPPHISATPAPMREARRHHVHGPIRPMHQPSFWEEVRAHTKHPIRDLCLGALIVPALFCIYAGAAVMWGAG
jgi:hypothetical protein